MRNDNPLWLVHSAKKVDVIVIPLPFLDHDPNINLYPLNTLSNQNLSIQIGMDVFILGYPFGPEMPGFPVWKRGSIASEPDLVRLAGDYLLVDSASRPGMSGAPVIRRTWGVHPVEGGNVITSNDAPYTRFIGVYSGRRHTKDPSDAQIGMVWHSALVDEIITAGKRDQY
jgi:hypothetical protein